jgi:succinate dehydrogenase/fumarate reductase-like Fe-S protein
MTNSPTNSRSLANSTARRDELVFRRARHWALPLPGEHDKTFRIYRWKPANGTKPTPTALDALIKINDQMAPALSFRRSTDRYLGYSILLQSQRWLADSRDQRTAEGES